MNSKGICFLSLLWSLCLFGCGSGDYSYHYEDIEIINSSDYDIAITYATIEKDWVECVLDSDCYDVVDRTDTVLAHTQREILVYFDRTYCSDYDQDDDDYSSMDNCDWNYDSTTTVTVSIGDLTKDYIVSMNRKKLIITNYNINSEDDPENTYSNDSDCFIKSVFHALP